METDGTTVPVKEPEADMVQSAVTERVSFGHAVNNLVESLDDHSMTRLKGV